MRLLQHKTNPYTNVRYRLFFESKEWEWIIYAKHDTEPKWVRICSFTDLDAAELHFHTLTYINKGKVPNQFEMEEMI